MSMETREVGHLFKYYLIANCYLQNWFDVKIVWNCYNSVYQF